MRLAMVRRRLTARPARFSPRLAFLVRMLAVYLAVLGLTAAGFILAQSRAARELVTQDARARHLAHGESVERAYAHADGGEDQWDEVRESLRHVAAVEGAKDVLILGADGGVLAAADPSEEGTAHGAEEARSVIENGNVLFHAKMYEGHELFEFVSPVRLGDRAYALEVEFAPVLLEQELAALRASTFRVLLLGMVVAVPLLYLLGGRRLSQRYSEAANEAVRDGLTGLHNRRAFEEALEQEVTRAQRYNEPLTLALIDLDDFKLVNDTHGHRRGDEILTHLAAALRTGRGVDLPFRIGGDEFALLLPHSDAASSQQALHRVRHSALERMGGTTISVGVAQLGREDDAEVLAERADAALYEAKRRGRDQVVSFDDILERTFEPVTSSNLADLRALLDSRQLGTAFQPIWDLDAQRVLGYEGLARPHPEYGFTGPAEAFMTARRLKRVDELDELCHEKILDAAHDIPDDILLFLNVAPESLDHGSGVAARLEQQTRRAGLTPDRVVLELTEQATDHMDLVVEHVTRLRDVGFHIALDDVGAGETGLLLMSKIRPDYVKIDRGIVKAARPGTPEHAVLVAVLAYAQSAGSMVIAEGIETQDMLNDVRDTRVVGVGRIKGVQGYALGMPDTSPAWRVSKAASA